MKKFLFALLLTSLFTVQSCKDNFNDFAEDAPVSAVQRDITIEEAKSWFENESKKWQASSRTAATGYQYEKKPVWETAYKIKTSDGTEVVVAPNIDAPNAPTPILREVNKKSKGVEKKHEGFKADILSTLIMYKDKSGKMQTEIALLVPEDDFYSKKGGHFKNYSGAILVTDFNDNFLKGYSYKNDKLVGGFASSRNNKKNAKVSVVYECGAVDWYSCAYTASTPWDQTCSYLYTETLYCQSIDSDFDYLNLAGGGGAASVASLPFTYIPGIETPPIDIMEELKCFTGNNSSSSQYKIGIYVDQPIANSSTSTVGADGGHTFIGFTKITNGQTITRYVGFYPQSGKELGSLFGYVTPEIHSNSTSPYEVSLTYNVSNTQFSNAINSALTWPNYEYNLSGFNCTDAALMVFDAANLFVPKPTTKVAIGVPNSYAPVEPTYLFIHSPAALGQSLRSLKNSGSSLNIVTSSTNDGLNNSNTGNCN